MKNKTKTKNWLINDLIQDIELLEWELAWKEKKLLELIEAENRREEDGKERFGKEK